ncbi:MAG TPA: hypothetical protein ENN09_02385 [Planctomycetes bacterium]|nr:hypothetical protein [Planctomycetota bacterium]
MPRREKSRPLSSDSGVVLVMVLVIALVLTMAATAFMVLANMETHALNYRSAAVRAELAAHSGLYHAVAVINKVTAEIAAEPRYVATPDGMWDTGADPPVLDADWGWGGYFSGTVEVVSREDFDPYGDEDYGNGVAVRSNERARIDVTVEVDGPKTADYAVLIADMDGRLPANPGKWTLAAGADYKEIYRVVTDALGLSGKLDELAGDASSPSWRAFGELAAACKLSSEEAAALRPYVTPYFTTAPERPRVNINTARARTIEALLAQIPSLDGAARDAIVTKLVSARPFRGRRELEAAIEELAPPHEVVGKGSVGSGVLSEMQFNDLLNSLNSSDNPSNASIFSNDADYTAGDPASAVEGSGGVYEFDFDPDPPPVPPVLYSQTGGEHTSSSDVTWGCEVIFRSRFYEILVLARGWRLEDGRGRAAERLLWAGYDAENGKVLWRRWLFPADR